MKAVSKCWTDSGKDAQSRYGDHWFKNIWNDFTAVSRLTSDPTMVVSDLAHAVTSTRPKSR